ncbi:Por secretion system C-terminal sorting domain-containing protein [Flaviramulus basaltis]|uniref:Por secretion system C-terminal sorting domain-containing protein n=1 Tax=Flaviramulus basaltis TaxID=369401 RepID=A0A1K2IBD4_9FLAO|nr:T9SS type A sorting domain-containing protein [Flaviramulus basaltis]SFZ89586.1 Por secretion system C-terminal sorting domain-containing protein [Flaviramulus basaltis]
MKKNYFFFLLIALAFFTTQQSVAQSDVKTTTPIHQNIEGLSIYPNPVSSGKTYIYITSKYNFNKKIEFYNVLGKQIFSTNLTGKELNISNLSKGVYILKITENNTSETRKLVIK